MATVGDLLMEARCRLMIKEPWYGHMAMNMIWRPCEFEWERHGRSKTMAVTFAPGGKVVCLYYKPFVASLTLKQLYGVVQHEIEHLVRLHLVRIGSRDDLGWNLACDMTVNGKKDHPRIGYRDEKQHVLPAENMIWIPPTWDEKGTAEEFYDKMEQMVKMHGGFSIDADGNIRGLEAEGVGGQILDNHMKWRGCEVSEDEARQIVKGLTDQAAAAAPGNVPGHLAEIIADLDRPVVHWRGLLHQYLGRHVGNKRLTYSRVNRRRDEFGIKGISRHACATVRVIVDTSGSVSSEQLRMFFAEIEQISSRAVIKLLQWDHGFQGYGKYKRGGWKGFKIHGRGGTDMEAPVTWLEQNHEVGDVQIMLTDGEVSKWPDQRAYPFIFVVMNHNEIKMPEWGHPIFIRYGSK